MQVKVLKRLFGRLRDSYSAVGADEPARDMRRIADLLQGHEDKPVEEFVAEIRAMLHGDEPVPSERAPRIVTEVVERHVRGLLGAGVDRTAFEAAMAHLDDDGDVGKIELFAIANRYRNEPSAGTHQIKFKSLKQARSSIRDVFLERADAQSKRGAIDRLTKRIS
jgi:hypothetical protein